MALYGWPILFTVLVWWFSTGAVMYLVGLRRVQMRWSMGVASLVAGLAFIGLYVTSDDQTVGAALASFACAILVWGWHEMSFLVGLVTGPRTTPLPAGASRGARLWCAIETVIYHELAIFLTLLAVAWVTAGGVNRVGLWTFVILWVMRLSAKINLFLGVPNCAEELLPDHLSYLASYFRRRAMNLLFPLSIMGGTAVTALLVAEAAAAGATAFEATGLTLLASLLGLAVLEHWFMVVPLPNEALWSWGLASRRDGRKAEAGDTQISRGGKAQVACPASIIA